MITINLASLANSLPLCLPPFLCIDLVNENYSLILQSSDIQLQPLSTEIFGKYYVGNYVADKKGNIFLVWSTNHASVFLCTSPSYSFIYHLWKSSRSDSRY